MPKRRLSYRPQPRLLSPEAMSILNQETHEQQTDYRANPQYREITSAEAKEHREREKQHAEELRAASSFTKKSEVTLAFSDEEAAIKDRYIAAKATDDPENVDDPPPAEFYEETEPPAQGFLWDPDGLSLQTQTGLDAAVVSDDIEEIDERLSDGDTIYGAAGWLPGVVWDPYSRDLSEKAQREEGYGPPGYIDPEE